jgi:hypothetical protein
MPTAIFSSFCGGGGFSSATKKPWRQPGLNPSLTSTRVYCMNPQFKLEITELTPDLARAFLKNNDGNRRLDLDRVDKIADDILNDRFVLTADAIQLSPENRLLNGQTRSAACVKANRPIPVVLATNVSETIFPLIDGNRPRSLYFRAQIPQKESEVAALLMRIGMSQPRKIQIDLVILQQIAAAIKPWSEILQEIVPTRCEIFTSAPGRAATIISLIYDSDPVYSLSLLRNLSLSRTVDLPPVGHSLIQQKMSGRGLLKGGGSDVQKNNFCRMRYGLSPDYRYKQKLIVNESMQQQALNDVRKLTATILSGRPIVSAAPIPTAADFA